MNFHDKWRSFLNEGVEDKPLTEEEIALIAEGRKDDAAKKYPQVERFIDRLANLDPSKNNKYLMWMTKQLAVELDRHLEGPLGRDPEAVKDFEPQDEFFVELFNHAIKIGDEIAEFHKNIQRIKNKDINSYKSLDDLISVTKELGFSKRQKKRGEKMKALEDVEVLIENDYFVLARPYTVDAAAILGGARGATSWCIARGSCNVEGYDGREEWFTKYTDEGKSFYYVISKFLPKSDDASLQALTVLDQDVININNRDNKDIDHSDFYRNMEYVLAGGAVSNPEKTLSTLNRDLEMGDDVPEDVQTLVKTLVRDFGEEYGETIEDPNDVEEVLEVLQRIFDHAAHDCLYASREHEGENPAGPDAEDFEVALRDHEHSFEDIQVDVQDPRDWGGNRWIWNAYASIDLPEDLPWIDTGDGNPMASDYEEQLDDIFKDAMDDLGIYPDEVEVEINDYEETIRVRFEPDHDEHEGVTQFKVFLNRMAEYDKKYPQILEKAIEELGNMGYIKSEKYDARKQMFDELEKFKNLNKKFEKGIIHLFTPKFDLPLPGLLKALNYDKLEDTREQHQREQGAVSIVQKTFLDRSTKRIEQNIRSPYTDFLKDWLRKTIDLFVQLDQQKDRQMKLLEDRAWDTIPYKNIEVEILAPDIQVSPSPALKATIHMKIKMTDDMDQIKDTVQFAKYVDRYLDDVYKILIDQTLDAAAKFGKLAMEEEPQLFKPAAGAQEDPSGWKPGMPTPEETMGVIDSVMEENQQNKLVTGKTLFDSWREYLK